tara:strand:- start:196 stop:504 length:309 start_codon:yes stop_codon:yes gene_type:complete
MANLAKGSIDVLKIPKDKLIDGKKGKYLNIVIGLNNEVDSYGNQGAVYVEQSKEERDAKAPKIYLGNIKVIWTDGKNVDVDNTGTKANGSNQSSAPEDDLPF